MAGLDTAHVIPFSPAETHIDDLKSIIDPSKARDILLAFEFTPPDLRPELVLLLGRLTQTQWAEAAGVGGVNLHRWLTRKFHLPLGAAFRLAKVVGLPAEELFEGWV